jgi:hypothetical protein
MVLWSAAGCGPPGTSGPLSWMHLGEDQAAAGGMLEASTCIRRSEILRAERTLEG